MTEIQLDLEVLASSSLSYTYAGVGRPVVRGISVRNRSSVDTEGLMVKPRVTILSPTKVADVWVGSSMPLPPARSDEALRNESSSPEEFERKCEDQMVYWNRVTPALYPDVLSRLGEKENARLVVEILAGDNEEVVAEKSQDLLLLAGNQWIEDPYHAASLAAFVMPNSRAVQPIITKARDLLKDRTGDSSTGGYQSDRDAFTYQNGTWVANDERNRSDLIAEAIYDAIRSEEIKYSNPPASWDRISQKIRTPLTILEDKAGTCLDTTVLYASCLAAAGLTPTLFLVPEHAFAGYVSFCQGDSRPIPLLQDVYYRITSAAYPGKTIRWLLGDNADDIYRWFKIPLGKPFVQMVETTTLCGGDMSKTFKEACISARESGWDRSNDIHEAKGAPQADESDFLMINVKGAWAQGYAPPSLVENRLVDETDDTFQLQDQSAGTPVVEDATSSEPVIVDVDGSDDKRVPPRVLTWMNSLLDLGAGNKLLKMTPNQSAFVEFDVPGDLLGKIDDQLFDPESGSLLIQTPAVLPDIWKHSGVTTEEFHDHARTMESPFVYPSFKDLNQIQKAVQDNIENRDEYRLPPHWTNADIERLMTQQIQDSWFKTLSGKLSKIKSARDEILLRNGTNSLFLTLGSLSFQETTSFRGKASGKNWLAPLYLYPVLLEGGRGSPFTLRLDPNGSITPNYCLREKLRREPYNLDLAELEYPETDEFGIDFDKMFGSIEARIRDKKLDNFELQRRCVLGVFNYSRFRLWKDLRDDWEKMRDTNPVVKHLMYTPGKKFEDPVEIPEPRLEPHSPLMGNDSQTEVIQHALDGQSLKVEGPPGTGKTQMIANLIASCLAHGKKVLFVAEKPVALNQVHKKLNLVGLDNYCLELHAKGDSDKRIRKNIEEQLIEALGESKDPLDRKWEDLSFRISAEGEILDNYRDALHSVNEAEFSLWTSREELLQIEQGNSIEIPREFVRKYGEFWPIFREICVTLPNLIEIAGSLTELPWGFVENVEYKPIDKPALSLALESLASVLDDFNNLAGPWQKLHAVTCVNDLNFAIEAAKISALGELPTSAELTLIGGASWEKIAEELKSEIKEINESLADSRKSLSPAVMVRDDRDNLIHLTSAITTANFFSANKHRKALCNALGNDALTTDTKELYKAAVQVFGAINQVDEMRSRISQELRVSMPAGWSPMEEKAVESFSTRLELFSALAQRTDSPGLGEFFAELNSGTPVDSLSSAVVEQIYEKWCSLQDILPFSDESVSRWLRNRTFLQAWTEDQSAWLNDRGEENRYLQLSRWLEIIQCALRLKECGLSPLYSQVLDGSLPVASLESGVRRGFLKASYNERLEAGDIDNFDGMRHDLRIANLDKAYKEARKLMKERIPGIVSQRKKKFSVALKRDVGEIQDLRRELKPIRGQKTPIRTLIQKYGESLTDVMPCLMMSPDSVATLIPVGSVIFDLVIFDEASQIPTPNAIGALGRGRASLVVGDTEQMPPTNFFNSNAGRLVEHDEEFDENVDVEDENVDVEDGDSLAENVLVAASAPDVESVLAEFQAANVPSRQLLTHFRSENEVLIAFSNTEIYNKEPMMTFPSTAGNSEKAMDFRRVDGQYLRSATIAGCEANPKHPQMEAVKKVKELGLKPVGTNPVEADAVVEEIIERLCDPKRNERRKKEIAEDPESAAESILVVTFNVAQQKLIEALLDKHPKSEEANITQALKEQKDEESGVTTDKQLKIRNLETCQGDEAETVIFSIAFSKKSETEVSKPTNNVPLMFGPVSATGGYKRLNVAVTRTKQKLIIFCSFDPSDMKVTENHSHDLQLLRKFLIFAKNPDQSGDASIPVQRSFHIEQIAQSIREMGYRAKTQHGLSSLRVDVAVGQSDEKDWKVAVLVDGPSWRTRGSVEQREVMPLGVLPSRGWKKVIRVWLPSWLDEKDAVLERIRKAMEGIEEAPDTLPDDDDETLLESNQNESPEEKPADTQHFVDASPVNTEGQSATGVTAGGQLQETTNDSTDTHPEFKPFIPEEMGTQEYLDVLGDPHRYKASDVKYFETEVNKIIDLILTAEAPIELSRLARMTANCLGFQQVRKNRVDAISNLIPKELIAQTPFGDYVWASPTQADTWTEFRPSGSEAAREVQEISPMEYSNALVDLITVSRSLSREDAVRVVAEVFGFNRLTQKTRNHIEKIVDYVIQQNLIFADDDERLRVTEN